MKARITQCIKQLFTLCLIFAITIVPSVALGQTNPGALTITSRIDGVAQNNLVCRIWKVAEADESTWVEPFDRYKYSLSVDSEEQAATLAATLAAVTVRDNISPGWTGRLNGNGETTFPGLPDGTYLITADNVTVKGREYKIRPTLVIWHGYWTEREVELKGEVLPEETVTRKVLKVWKDDKASVRPEEVTVLLMRDGREYDRVKLSAANQWRYTWSNLAPGHDYVIVETDVPSAYSVTASKSGITTVITNTLKPEKPVDPPDDTPETIARKVIKVWAGDDAATRPSEVTVLLMRDGQEYDRVKLSEANQWTHTWPKLMAGHTYDIVEDNVPESYISASTQTGNTTVITNIWNPEKTDIPPDPTVFKVMKVWAGDNEASRPSSVAVLLRQDGREYDRVNLSDENQWSFTWAALEAGHTYDVIEENIPKTYISSISQSGSTAVITNTWVPELQEPVVRKVVKEWADDDESRRPDKVTIVLMQDGHKYDQIALSEENQWTYSWTDLEAGHTYDVIEDDIPESYTATITQDGDTTIVTNTWTHDDPHLPKTGTSWWLVHLLAGSGVCLVIIGSLMTRYGGEKKS